MAHFPRLPKLTRRTLAAGLFVATLAALGTAYAAGLFRKTHNPNEIVRNGLMVLAGELDLGEVYETDFIEHDFKIYNATNRQIEILGWNATCDCSIVEPKKIVCRENSATIVTIRINVAKAMSNRNSQDDDFITIACGAIQNNSLQATGEMQTQWIFTGKVKPLIKGPKKIILTKTNDNQNEKNGSCHVVYTLANDWNAIELKCNGIDLECEVIENANQILKVEVSSNSKVVGVSTGKLTIQLACKTSNISKCIEVPIFARVKSNSFVSPLAIIKDKLVTMQKAFITIYRKGCFIDRAFCPSGIATIGKLDASTISISFDPAVVGESIVIGVKFDNSETDEYFRVYVLN